MAFGNISSKLAGNPFVRENGGILRASASNHVDPSRPEMSGGGQEKGREERRRRRISAELEARLHQYQEAVALLSPTTTPTPTRRADRGSSPIWGQDLKPEPSHPTAISTTSTITPHKSRPNTNNTPNKGAKAKWWVSFVD